jgi:hypothetical protein
MPSASLADAERVRLARDLTGPVFGEKLWLLGANNRRSVMNHPTFLRRRAASRAGRTPSRGLLIALAATVASLAAASTALAVPGDSSDTAILIHHSVTFDSSTYTGTTGSYQSCGDTQNSHAVWFKWVANRNGSMEANTYGSSYDTVLNVMDSSLTEIQCDDDFTFAKDCPSGSGSSLCSEVDFTATKGDTYYFLVGAFDSRDGGPGKITVGHG